MKTIRIGICDDDKMALTVISGAVRSAFETHGIQPQFKIYSAASKLWEEMEAESFQLLMLDIQMPGLDGIDFGRRLRKRGSKIDIIYVSNCENRVFEALSVQPFGFVRKAMFLKDLSEVIGRYVESMQEDKKGQRVDLPTRCSGRIHVAVDDILYFEGNGMYQMLAFRGGKQVQIASRMDHLETVLLEHGFLRIHKGYLVNYRCIARLDKAEATLTDGKRLPISRRRAKQIRLEYLRLGTDLGVVQC